MPNGGKRPGAGRKGGVRDAITRDESQTLRPRVFKLLKSILTQAEKFRGSKDFSKKVLAFKEVAPYILKKQPQQVYTSDIDLTDEEQRAIKAEATRLMQEQI